MTINKVSIFQNYYFMLLLISLGMGVVFYLASFTPLTNIIYPEFWFVQFASLSIACATHLITSFGLKFKTEMQFFSLVGMGLRFFLSIIVIFIAVFILKEGMVAFLIDFFILYLVFTSFEIYFLLRNLRPDSKNEGATL